METTNEKIKRLRLELGMSLEDLGKKVGVNRATVYRWENGEIGSMTTSKLSDIARALHVTPEYLIGWDSPKKEEKSPDEELRFALFGGESATDEEMEEVRQFVEFIKAKRKNDNNR